MLAGSNRIPSVRHKCITTRTHDRSREIIETTIIVISCHGTQGICESMPIESTVIFISNDMLGSDTRSYVVRPFVLISLENR